MKKLFLLWIFSIIFSKNGILAASDVVNFTGFELPVAQTTAVRDNKIKNDEDRQALFIISTTSDRNFEFWVYDYTLGQNTDTVNANFSGDVKTIYKGDTGRPADGPWFLVGTKKLNMRTTRYHFTTTIFNGTWYLSERDI